MILNIQPMQIRVLMTVKNRIWLYPFLISVNIYDFLYISE
jgi:hypothetical protein